MQIGARIAAWFGEDKEEEMYKDFYMALVSKKPLDTLVDSVTTELSSGAFYTLNNATDKPIRKIVFKNNINGSTSVFTGNQAIEELVFEGDVRLSTWALQNMAGLKSFTVLGTIAVFGSYTFQAASKDLQVYMPNITSTSFFTTATKNVLSYCPDTAVFHMADGDFDRSGNPVVATASANGGGYKCIRSRFSRSYGRFRASRTRLWKEAA